jgi:hypothetical protein
MKTNNSLKQRSKSGQSVTEYFILTILTVGMFLFFGQSGFFTSLKGALDSMFGSAVDRITSSSLPAGTGGGGTGGGSTGGSGGGGTGGGSTGGSGGGGTSGGGTGGSVTGGGGTGGGSTGGSGGGTSGGGIGGGGTGAGGGTGGVGTGGSGGSTGGGGGTGSGGGGGTGGSGSSGGGGNTGGGGQITLGSQSDGIWIQGGSEATLGVMNSYKAQGISTVYIAAGYWGSDGNIHTETTQTYGFSQPDALKTAVANAHEAGLKIYPWVTGQRTSFPDTLDIHTDAIRQKDFTSMINFVNEFGFDGFQDDPEEIDYWYWSDWVAYLNGAAAAMHSIGKQYVASLCAQFPSYMGSDLFSQIKIDGIQPMMYWNTMNHDDFVTYLTFTLTYAASPIKIALHTGNAYVSLPTTMSWVDEVLASGVSTAQFAGVDLFWASALTPEDSNAWNNWKTKDGILP